METIIEEGIGGWALCDYEEGENLYICYGEDGTPSPENGTTEALSHFLEEGESYPLSEEQVRSILRRFVSEAAVY